MEDGYEVHSRFDSVEFPWEAGLMNPKDTRGSEDDVTRVRTYHVQYGPNIYGTQTKGLV